MLPSLLIILSATNASYIRLFSITTPSFPIIPSISPLAPRCIHPASSSFCNATATSFSHIPNSTRDTVLSSVMHALNCVLASFSISALFLMYPDVCSSCAIAIAVPSCTVSPSSWRYVWIFLAISLIVGKGRRSFPLVSNTVNDVAPSFQSM